jgi:hypothetical protein
MLRGSEMTPSAGAPPFVGWAQISNFFRVRPSTDMPFSIRESVE